MKHCKLFFRILLIVIFIFIYTFSLDTFYEEKNKQLFFDNNFPVASTFNMVLEIPKINLKKGLYDIDSEMNNVEKNIEINKVSDYPSVEKGNLILESHSGTSKVSYFKNLDKLTKSDEVIVYFNNIKYVYLIDNFYYIKKTGTAKIKRDNSKNAITLITCSKGMQIVYIGYLFEKSSY